MAVLWGSGLMLAYDCLRMLRMMIRQRKGIQAAEEAVFMVVRWMLAVLRPIRQIVRIFKTFVKNAGNTLQSAAAKRTIKGRKLQQRQGEHDDS